MSEAEDWGAELTKRIGDEIRRLRGDRSGQWLSDRTEQLGQRVSRSTISEIETGRRKSITVSDLILLAAALDTTPVALVYPGPYRDLVRFTPNQEVPQIWAAQWFSGLHRSVSHVPFSAANETMQAADPEGYTRNISRLRRGRRMWELSERKSALWRDLQIQKYEQRRGRVTEKEIDTMVNAIADLQRQIDELGDEDGR